jgi:hypothetical protein
MKYWAGLHGVKDAEDIRAGADNLMRLASISKDVGAGIFVPNPSSTVGR